MCIRDSLNTQPIMNDNQVQPNYIPQENKPTEDYINNYADENEMMMRKYKEDNRKDSLEILFEEFKIPLFISLLFFIFQLPFLKKNLIKYIPFAFLSDGNYNLNGYFISGFLFGVTFYILNKIFDVQNF